MGDTDVEARLAALALFQVDAPLMAMALNAIFDTACSPTARGPGRHRRPRSVVFDEAENRIHAQKSIRRGVSRARTGAARIAADRAW